MSKCLSTTIYFLGFFIALSALASAKVNTKICRKKNGVFPKPGSLCKGYYKCTNFIPTEFLCPEEHHFSTVKLRCDWMELFPCLEKPKREECPTSEGKFLKPGTGCTYYYDCCNGEPTEKKCPQGRLFDPSKRGCESKEHYTCIESIFTETPVTTILVTTRRISESTPEEIIPSTTSNRESTPGEILPSTTSIRESTPEEIVPSTTSIRESTPEEILPSTTSIRESTPEEIVPSTTSSKESTSEEIAHSTASTRESTSEEVYSTTSIRESTPGERVSSETDINESTPEEIVHSTTSIRYSTPEEIAYSTTSIDETTPEEIEESTTLFFETTFEESTTVTIDTDKRTTVQEIVSLSTENEQITDEPNIMCPEPFGYFPHPTDKHKFVGCVDNIPSVLTCPSDLIYDHKHRQCVYQ